MAHRLPGGFNNPQDLWGLLIAKKDARTVDSETRHNAAGYHWPTKKPGHTITKHDYLLDHNVDIGALDTIVFPKAQGELEFLDPQQQLLLEVSRESIDDAGEVNWQGTDVGIYVGTFGNDWYDILQRVSQRYGAYDITTSHDFSVSKWMCHLMDLHGQVLVSTRGFFFSTIYWMPVGIYQYALTTIRPGTIFKICMEALRGVTQTGKSR